MFDLITVVHNDDNKALALNMWAQVEAHEGPLDGDAFRNEYVRTGCDRSERRFNAITVDNSVTNRGFGPACNLGATLGAAPYIGFLNPDVDIQSEFLKAVTAVFEADPNVVITGKDFEKSRHELNIWGVRNWVCGAVFFVRRSWWEQVGGFDEQFVWGWEETDLIRRAQVEGKTVQPIHLPISHASPQENTPEDAAYKNRHFDEGARRYYTKWGR